MKKIQQFDKEGTCINSFDTITEAANFFSVNESSIRKVLNNTSRTCAGFIWKTKSMSPKDLARENEILKQRLQTIIAEKERIVDNGSISSENGNVLVIGDLHEPFTLDGYFEFIKETRDRFNCKTIISIGDIVDNYATSRWDHDPDGMSAGDEYKAVLNKLQKWYKEFPELIITVGNHDSRMFRTAFKAGLPKSWVRDYSEIFKTPAGWKFVTSIEVDGVDYSHGDGSNGDMAALNRAKEMRQSCVVGHGHSFAGVRYMASRHNTIFGMNVGCGVDANTYAMSYAKDQTRRPVISCGVVMDYGKQPIVIIK